MNYDKKLKRILAFILAAALVITYMPSGMKAYAAGESDQPEVTESVAEESAAAVSEPSDDADEDADADTNADASEDADSEDGSGVAAAESEEEQPAEPEEEKLGETVVLTAEGSNYNVTVTCGPKSGVPEGARLQVSELTGRKYNQYLKKTADALETDKESMSYVLLLDISIFDGDKKIQPDTDVDVSIQVKNADIDDNKEDINIVHFGNETEILEADVNNSKNKVSFETDSFSIYAITSTPTTDLDGKKLAIVHSKLTGLDNSNNKRYLGRALSDRTYNTNYLAADNAAIEIHATEENLVTATAAGEAQPNSETKLTEWTFESAGETNQYYIKTGEGDSAQYLNLTANGLALSDTPQAITVSPGTASGYTDKVRLSASVNGTAKYVRSSVSNERDTNGNNPYFTSGASDNKFCYMTLCEIKEEEIGNTKYTGIKISSQDLVDAESYMLYQSLYNPATDKYEDYVIDCDGTVRRAYDNGDELSLYGDEDSCPMWMLRVCTNSNGEPTGYYVFKNEKTGMILYPLADGTLLKEYDPTTADTSDGLTLPGRETGKYTSKVDYWDDSAKNYVGYQIVDDNGTYKLQTASGDGSQSFSFAKRKEESTTELHEVSTVDSKAAGITIHMFDYPNRNTIVNVTGSDSFADEILPDKHASMTLTDGYPTFKNGTSSGSALFDPSNSYHKGEGNHLFLADTYNSTGYYEYSAFHNFAHYNQNTGDFTVYSETGTPNATGSKFSFKRGNFMPFNELDTSANASRAQNLYNGDGYLLDYQDPNYGGTLYGLKTSPNYYFGMTMEYEFMMPKDGLDRGNPLVYEFTGDDDLWIYIDGVLILDIGGVHNAWSGTINFATGQIHGKVGSDGVGVTGAGGATTIKQCFENAGVFPDGTQWDDSRVDEYFKGETFVDYGSHTFNMFYMEHGAGASNLNTRFNLPVIEKDKVTVAKELANTSQVDYANAAFAYQAFKREGEEHYVPLTNAVYEGKTDDDGDPVPLTFYNDVEINGVEYDNVFYLKPGEAAVFSDIVKDQYYFVQEIGIDSDYYDEVYVNEVQIDGETAEAQDGIYKSSESTVRARPRITFKNKCDNRNSNELLITKRLAQGCTDNGDTFEFRVMLENASGKLVPYYQGKYYIRDDDGVYYKYQNGKLMPNGQTPYECTAGNYGTISEIPPDYTVVIKDLVAGTDFYVDEIRVKDAAGTTKLVGQSGWKQDSRVVSDCDDSDISDAEIYDYATNATLTDQSSLGRIAWNKDAKVVFTNSRRYGQLKIVKELHEKSADVELSENISFTVSGPADYGTDGTKTITYGDFTDGVYIEEVPMGTYEVTEDEESAAIAGYKLVVTYEPEDKKAVVTEGTDPTDEGTVKVINNYMPIEPVADAKTLKIKKVDQDNKPLKGVTFTLTNGSKSMTAETDVNGECEFAITCGSGDTDLLPVDERDPNSDAYDMTLTESPVNGYAQAGPWTVKAETKKNDDGTTEVTLSDVKERTVGGKTTNFIERLIHWLISQVTSDDPNFTFDEDTIKLTITNNSLARTVRITKTFTGLDNVSEIPSDYKVNVSYVDNDAVADTSGAVPTTDIVLTTASDDTHLTEVSEDGKTYTWEIGKVRGGTAFSAQEKGYIVSGYTVAPSVTVTGASNTATDPTEAEFTVPTTLPTTGQPDATVAYTNTYTAAPAIGEIKVKKSFTGRDWTNDDKFTFTIEKAQGSANNTPMPAASSVDVTKSDTDYTDTFGAITFNKPGTYIYTVKETPGPDNVGITYDGKSHTVTFEIVADSTGQLVAKEGTQLTATETFNNSYSALGEGEVKVSKTLNGRAWTTDDEFEFTITPVGDAPAFTDNTAAVTKNSTGYTASFGTVTFNAAGTYQWTVTETHKGETIDGIAYDSADKTVTIEVVDDGKGHLVAAEGSALVQTAAFTNNYSATGEGEVKVKKTLNGRAWATDDSFEFTITPVGNAPAFTNDTVIVTKDSENYTGSFGTVTFTKAGTYQWTVTETHKGETIDGIAYDSTDKTVAIEVVDDGKGNLVAAEGSALEQTAAFTNDYSATGEGEVKVKKILEGRDWTENDSFEFTITPIDDAPAFTNDTVIVTKDSENYTGSFGTVTFTKAGTYQWTVTETHKGEFIDGIAYDSTDKTVTIVTKDDGKGHIVADTGSDLVQTAEFTNVYMPADVVINKTINKHTSIDGTVLKSTFAFRVQGYKGNVEVFNNVIGIDFEPNSALSDQVTLASVRGDIDKVVVTEINSGNYTPDPVTQEVTSSSATGYSVVNNRQVFTFSFDNTQSGKEYNTGVINRYEKNDSGYGPPSSGGSQP